jgi:Uma2 family endonuclease
VYQYELPRYFPTADELPYSDDTPVDNELQELIPSLLKSILRMLWDDRMDWFFGINMAIYTEPERPPIVPDAFLALNVERVFDEKRRLSYLRWEEPVPPILVLEIVTNKHRGEYTTKLDEYAQMGVLYYAIYNPKRKRTPKLEIYKLVKGNYELQTTNPLWIPEISLGIGSERASYDGSIGEWLYWYDENNQRYPTPYDQLRALGIEPEIP